ncbi:hypothetical protein LINPERPRIM_LOCUS9861 [Linum perenne]
MIFLHQQMINIRTCRSYNFPRQFSSSRSVMENNASNSIPAAAASDPIPNTSNQHQHDQQRVSDAIIPHLLNLYASRATAADFEIYAEDASFEDPLMSAQGVKQIKSAFYSLSKVHNSLHNSQSMYSVSPYDYYNIGSKYLKVFKESRIVDYTVQENEISPGKQEVLIDNKQNYVIFGKNIEMISLIKLRIENGKIVRHEDCWDKKEIENRETTKLRMVGRLKEIVRRGSMFATHAAMGFGKDPSPQAQAQDQAQAQNQAKAQDQAKAETQDLAKAQAQAQPPST